MFIDFEIFSLIYSTEEMLSAKFEEIVVTKIFTSILFFREEFIKNKAS